MWSFSTPSPILYFPPGATFTTTRDLSQLCMTTIRYSTSPPFILSFLATPSQTTHPREASSILYPACRRMPHFSPKSLLLVCWACLRSHLHFYRWPDWFFALSSFAWRSGVVLTLPFRCSCFLCSIFFPLKFVLLGTVGTGCKLRWIGTGEMIFTVEASAAVPA